MRLENHLEQKLKKALNRFGYGFYKSETFKKGFPDRAIVPPADVRFNKGVTVYVELKRPGCKPTELQLNRIENLRSRGIPCRWLDDYDAVMLWVSQTYGDNRLSGGVA